MFTAQSGGFWSSASPSGSRTLLPLKCQKSACGGVAKHRISACKSMREIGSQEAYYASLFSDLAKEQKPSRFVAISCWRNLLDSSYDYSLENKTIRVDFSFSLLMYTAKSSSNPQDEVKLTWILLQRLQYGDRGGLKPLLDWIWDCRRSWKKQP